MEPQERKMGTDEEDEADFIGKEFENAFDDALDKALAEAEKEMQEKVKQQDDTEGRHPEHQQQQEDDDRQKN